MAHHRIRIEVLEETDVLRRVTLLNSTLMRVITGTKIVRLLEADYNIGAVDVIIEGATIDPNPAPGEVRVEYLPLPLC